MAEVFALLLPPPPPPIRVLFAFRRDGREKLLAYRFASDVDVEYWHTGRSSNLERKFWRNGATTRRDALLRFSRPLSERWQPSCGAFYSRSTCRIVFEVALNVRDAWRETKCDWHLGEEKNIPPPPSFLPEATKSDNEAKKETTDDDHSWLFTRVANESSFSSADTSANRARHGYSISTGGGGRKGTPAQFPRRPKRIANGISLSRAI